MAEEAGAPRPPARPRAWPPFETEPYRPSGGTSPLAPIILAGFTFPVAILCGFLLHFVGQWFYLILLFPGGAALAVVGVGFLGVQAGKVHSPLIAGLMGALAGALVMLSKHFFDYQASGIQAAGIGFFGFMDLRAHFGMVIAGKGGGQGMNLGYVGTYIYFAVELLFVVGICAAALYNFALAPFCTACDTWKKERTLGRFTLPVVETSPKTCDAAVAAFQKGKIARLVNEEPDSGGEQVAFVLTAFECLSCGEETPVDVALKCVTKDKAGKTTLPELARVTYPTEAVPVLESLCIGDDEKGEDDIEEVVEGAS